MAGNNSDVHIQPSMAGIFRQQACRNNQASRLLKNAHSIKDEIARRREVVIEELDLATLKRVIKRLLIELDGLGPGHQCRVPV